MYQPSSTWMTWPCIICQTTDNLHDEKLQEALDKIMWSSENDMRIYTSKTKEMVISFSRPPTPSLASNCWGVPATVCRFCDYTWYLNIKWLVLGETCVRDHKKAQGKLFTLNMHRHAKVSPSDIMNIFCSKIRPMIEYAPTPPHHHKLCKCLIWKNESPTDKLHRLLPQIQDTSHNARNAKEYPMDFNKCSYSYKQCNEQIISKNGK